MKLCTTGITCLLVAALLTATTAPLPAQSSCADVVGNLHTRTTALNNQAQINSANFLRDEVVGPALGAAKRTLEGAGDPTVAAYNQIQDARQKAQAWIDRLNSFDAFFTRLKDCMAKNCNMLDFIKAENAKSRIAEAAQDKLNEWVQSLGDNGITAAAERVNKVSSIVRDTVSAAQGIAMDGVTGAVTCMNQFVQSTPPASADTVNLGTSPTGTTAPPSSSGPSFGKILGWTSVFGVAIVGGAYVAQQAADLAEYSTPTGTSTGSPPVTTTPASGGSTANYRYMNWNCNGGSQCTTVLGANTGSVGPFCTVAACSAYQQNQFPSLACTTQPQYPIRSGPSGGRACSDQ